MNCLKQSAMVVDIVVMNMREEIVTHCHFHLLVVSVRGGHNGQRI